MPKRQRYYRIRNWHDYQHYKNRAPPWIKLHFSLLTSEDWISLTDKQRLLMVACMLIGSRHDGQIPDNPDYVKRVAYLDQRPDFKPLVQCGFLEKLQADASICEQMLADASTESEESREEESREERVPLGGVTLFDDQNQFPEIDRLPRNGRDRIYPALFNQFWETWPANENDTKASGYKSWRKPITTGAASVDQLQAGAQNQASLIEAQASRPRVHVQTWINREGWTAAYDVKALDPITYAIRKAEEDDDSR